MTTKTISIPFVELYSEDENDDITHIDTTDPSGIKLNITRQEYHTIRAIQRALKNKHEEKDAPFRYLRVCVSWAIYDTPNFTMNGCEFVPEDSELQISEYAVELVLCHYGYTHCSIHADLTPHLKNLFPEIIESKEVTQWEDLAMELCEHIVKEVNVRIVGDFAKIYPSLAHPELEEGSELKELLRYRYLAFQYEEAPADEDAELYALELLKDYRTSSGEMLLRVSEVDKEGQISLSNTVYETEKVEVHHLSNGEVELIIHTYDSAREGA